MRFIQLALSFTASGMLIILMLSAFAQTRDDANDTTALRASDDSDILLNQSITSTDNSITLSRVISSPAKIDRHVASRIAYPLYIRPQLTTKNTTIRIIDTIAHCSSEYIVDGPDVLYADSFKPYISLKIGKDAALNESRESITITCILDLVIGTANSSLGRASESFNITIPLYNLPIGSIEDNVQQKIDRASADIQNVEREIEKWEKTTNALQKIRDTASLVAQTDAVLSFVTTAIWGTSLVLYEIPLTQGAGSALWDATCSGYVGKMGSTGIHHLINLAVWYPGHFPGSITLPTPKTASIIQSCQLCNFGGTITATVPPTQGNILVEYDGKRANPTTLETITTFSFEPFKSIHVASACMCPAGIEYNLRKERQILCIYKNCIKGSAELGLPLDHCDRTLLEQNCLYVDGAAWKIAGGSAISAAIRDLLASVLGATPVMTVASAWTSVCNPIASVLGQPAYTCQANGGDPSIDWAIPLCGAWSGQLELLETDFFGKNKFSWNSFNGLLEGEDFCI